VAATTISARPPAAAAASSSSPPREELVARLTAHRGNVNRLAEEYGKDPKQIYRWLKRLGIEPDDYR
jgi:transcriptional regulator of acetoin/glycerol metabolism